ncbi:MAG TPA: aminotransferase class I/II-fold pyridoxal phosphate-dependent enzyme [Sphingobacteriaceae bacterium]
MSNKIYLSEKPGRTVRVDGGEYLFFSGYNYLGINCDPEFFGLLQEGLHRYGWLFPSSRISNTRLNLYRECEAVLSEITGTEDTVLLPSGFSAGRVATSLYEERLFNAPGSHPAIMRTRPVQNGFEEWCTWLRDELNLGGKSMSAIAADSLNPLTATIHDFGFLSECSRDIAVIIDDSHGIGVTGTSGRGVSSVVPRASNINYLFTYSLSKAFGIAGGAVSCGKQPAALLRTFPEYAAVTPQSPAQLHAFLHGQHIYSRQRQRLLANIQAFTELIQGLPGIHYSDDFPVFVLDDLYTEQQFLKDGILISSFAYPDPAGKKLNRIVINALHTADDLGQLAGCLKKAAASKPHQTSLI